MRGSSSLFIIKIKIMEQKRKGQEFGLQEASDPVELAIGYLNDDAE